MRAEKIKNTLIFNFKHSVNIVVTMLTECLKLILYFKTKFINNI